jgi:beta-galactosidase GanA
MFQLTTIDGRFQINGKELFLQAGEYHYFRVDPEHWERDLRRLKEEGNVNTISTYVPWIFHELAEGQFDFDGTTHPRRNLKHFLTLCREFQLPVILRPGPFIYSEYKGFGIPLWLGESRPEIIVRRVDGSPDKEDFYFNVSLNHPTYLEYVRKWFKQLAEQLRPFFDNPIVCFQLDNETGLMYNFNVGQIDFNEFTIEAFHTWLEQEFQNPQTLSVYCVESYLSFEEVKPPMTGLNVAKSMIWQSFFEDWVVSFIEQLRDFAMELNIPTLFAINEQGNYFNPSNPIKKSPLVEIYGYNINTKTTNSSATLDVPFGNSITPSIFKGYLQPEYQPLFASEMGCGWFDPRTKVSTEATVLTMLGSIAHGAKGVCMYVVRDGEDIYGQKYHYHSMLNHKGKKTKRFQAVQGVYQFVSELGEELLTSEEIYDEIAFASYAMNHRIIPGDLDEEGKVIRPIKIVNQMAEYGIYGMLLAHGYNPKPLALENSTLKDMKQFKTIFFHNRGAIVKADYTKLIDYVKRGGNLITGPNFPVMNEHGFPLNTQKLYPAVVSKQRVFGPTLNIAKAVWSLFLFQFQKVRLKRYNKYALYHLERTERRNLLRSWKPKGPFVKTNEGKSLKIDYLAREFTWQLEEIEPVLQLNGKPIAYRHTLGKGTNTVIGTPIGARYVIEAYYHLPKKIKEGYKTFLDGLLTRFKVQKTFDATVEVEIVGRRNINNKSLLLFLMNRGKKKKGTLRVLIPAKTKLPKKKQLQVDKIYCFKESTIREENTTLEAFHTEGLQFSLDEDDCLVIRLSVAKTKRKDQQ